MKKLFCLLLLFGMALVAGIAWFNHAHSGPTGEETYTVTSAEWGTLTESVSATGVLHPVEVIAVGSEVSGRVIEVYPQAEVNQVIEEETPLLKLDDRKALIELDRARSAVELARANVAMAEASRDGARLRVKRLRDLPADVGLRKELDEAEMLLKAAEATVRAAGARVKEAEDAQKLAQLGVDLCVVCARSGPRSNSPGSRPRRHFTVIDKKVTLGQLIGPPASAHLFTLASDLGHMQIYAQVSENDIGMIRVSRDAPQLARFTVYAYTADDVKFKGKVVEIRPMPTNVHGAVFYDTLIDVVNERDPRTGDWKLRPGMTAAVDIVLRQHTDIWKMPTEALSFQLDEYYQTEAAREKLAQWNRRNGAGDWKPVWILDSKGKPWPLFIRVGSKSSSGEPAISDGQFVEILEWDPELSPMPKPHVTATYPQVITSAPPVHKGGVFDKANVRVF